MFFVPGIIISLVTFPGVIFHEFAHQLFCRLMGIPVYKVTYFQAQNPCGYVIHERAQRPLANFMITFGPFIVNTLVGIIILLPVCINVVEFNFFDASLREMGVEYLIYIVALWLGFSILMHAFPSRGDADTLVESVLKNKEVGLLTKIVVAPFVGLIYIGAVGSMFWLDAAYAVGITVLLPKLIALLI